MVQKNTRNTIALKEPKLNLPKPCSMKMIDMEKQNS